MEERRKTTTEGVRNIGELEALCSKVVEQVSQSWEALIDDEELEKIMEQLHTVELELKNNEEWSKEAVDSKENGEGC